MSNKKFIDEINKIKNETNHVDVNLTREALLQNKTKWQLFLEGYKNYYRSEFSWPAYIKACKLHYGEFNIHDFIKTYGPDCEEDFKRFRQRVLEEKGINRPLGDVRSSSEPKVDRNIIELMTNGDTLRTRLLIRFLNPRTRAEKRNLKRSWKEAKKMKYTKAEWMKTYVGILVKRGEEDPLDYRYTRDEIFKIILDVKKQLDAMNNPKRVERQPERETRVERSYNDDYLSKPIPTTNPEPKRFEPIKEPDSIDKLIEERNKDVNDSFKNLSVFEPTQKVSFKEMDIEDEVPIRVRETLSTSEKLKSMSAEINVLSDNFKDIINDKKVEENKHDDLDDDINTISKNLDILSKSLENEPQKTTKISFEDVLTIPEFEKSSPTPDPVKIPDLTPAPSANINDIVSQMNNVSSGLTSNHTSNQDNDVKLVNDERLRTQAAERSEQNSKKLDEIMQFEKQINDQIESIKESNELISQELRKVNQLKLSEERQYEMLKKQRQELTRSLLNENVFNQNNDNI